MKLHCLLFLFIPIILITLSFSCKSPSEPEQIKNPREYTWTVDTLAYPGSIQTLMYSIWGSSPNDVYVGGHNERGFGKMYHYDGTIWSPVSTPGDIGAIYGFSSTNVWAVGDRIYYNPTPPPNFLDSSLVLHYDGSKWQEMQLDRKRSLTSIWGSSSNDLWMGGMDGALFHFDGNSIKKDSIPFYIPQHTQDTYNFSSITGHSSGALYLLLYVARAPEYRDCFYFFTRSSGSWALFDSLAYSFRSKLWASPQGTLYTTGYGIYKRVNNAWQSMQLDALTSTGITGTSDDNFFVVGFSGANRFSGEVFHYNGSDWYQYKNLQIPNATYYGVWTDGKEVFIVGALSTDIDRSIILHGK